MKFITTEQLYDKWKHKSVLELSDLVQIIEEEFDVSVQVQEGKGLDDAYAQALASDPNMIRQVKESRADREAGRTFSGEAGLKFLREQIREFERESSV